MGLDADGAALSRLPLAEYFAEGELRSKQLIAKLTPMFCKPLDADQKLAAALADAKKTGRAVFIRFDAPW
jgi:hypothetical protein